jgi:Na+-driven multidrug efflux pump
MFIYNRSLTAYASVLNSVRGADVALAAFGVVATTSQILLMPLEGLAQGMQPIIGYNYGAKRYARVGRALQISILYATVWMTFGFLVAELFPSFLIAIFNNGDADLREFGGKTIRIVAIFLPLVGFQTLSSHYFLSVGRARISIALSASRQLLLFIPAILLLPLLLPDASKIYGVIWASPVSDLLSAIIAFGFVFRETKRLKGLSEKQAALQEV